MFFFLLLWGVFNFGFIFVIQSMMTTAAEDGARAALRYQPVSNNNGQSTQELQLAATKARAIVARQTAQNSVPKVLKVLARDQISVKVPEKGPCSYNTNLTCFKVTVTFPYGQHPIIPALVNFPLIGSVGIPNQLTGTAVMQVDNANLLQN